MDATAQPLLEAQALKKHFRVTGAVAGGFGSAWLQAVDGVSFAVAEGETFGLVGESGCGKTTVGKLILRLEKPTAGRIDFRGQDINQVRRGDLRSYRAAVQAVFQDPYSSLDPRMRVGETIAEPLIASAYAKPTIVEQVGQILEDVGLGRRVGTRYPHEFSGGQRQRLAIARALVCRPKLVVLDEPVSALDVSVRAQILNLLAELQNKFDTAYLLIAHDLAVVRHMSKRIAVMYLGKIVECGRSDELYSEPLHPYTRALLSAALPARPTGTNSRIILPGEVPSPINPPAGCHFHPRCASAKSICSEVDPPLHAINGSQQVACHLYS